MWKLQHNQNQYTFISMQIKNDIKNQSWLKKIIERKHVWKERNKDCMEDRTIILDLERKKA